MFQLCVICEEGKSIAGVLDRAEEVLAVVPSLRTDEAQPQQLPEWFQSGMAGERTAEQTHSWERRWSRLSYKKRLKLAQSEPWTFSGWVAAVKETGWSVCAMRPIDAHSAIVEFNRPEWPHPVGDLVEVFKVAGAIKVEEVVDLEAP